MKRIISACLGVGLLALQVLAQEDDLPVQAKVQAPVGSAEGWLGMALYDLTESMANALSLPDAQGVMVSGVAVGGSAMASGIQRNDIVMSIDGAALNTPDEVIEFASDFEVGSIHEVSLLRNGELISVPLRIDRKPDEFDPSIVVDNELSLVSRMGSFGEGEFLGMELRPLTAEDSDRLGLSGHSIGFLVTGVANDSYARFRGVTEGIALLEINLEPIKSFDLLSWHLREARSAGRKYILLGLRNEERTVNVPLLLPDN